MKILRWVTAVGLVVAAAGFAVGLRAERMGYPPAEFTARRQALAKALGKGTVVLFGRTSRRRASGSARTTTSTTSPATRT